MADIPDRLNICGSAVLRDIDSYNLLSGMGIETTTRPGVVLDVPDSQVSCQNTFDGSWIMPVKKGPGCAVKGTKII